MHVLSNVARDKRAAAREAAIREAGTAWLVRKGTAAGFRVDPSQLYIDGYDRVHIPRPDARAVIFSTLTFQGVLTVEDPVQFLAAVLRGFGGAKGFGCGLMLIRRARL